MKRQNSELVPLLQPIQNLGPALQNLLRYYTGAEGQGQLNKLSTAGEIFWTGQGTDFLAAEYVNRLCQTAGIHSSCLRLPTLRDYLANSGLENAQFHFCGLEIPANIAGLISTEQAVQIGGKGQPQREMAYLPVFSDQTETLMALVWWVYRWLKQADIEETRTRLNLVRQRIQLIADGSQAYLERCLSLLKYSPRWILVGEEDQRGCLQAASQWLALYAGRLVPWTLTDDFAANFGRILDPDAAVIYFKTATETQFDEYLDRAEELGVVVVEVIDGFFAPHRSLKNGKLFVDTELSPIMGMVAARMLAISATSLG